MSTGQKGGGAEAAALLPRLFGKNPRSHHKGPTDRVRTEDVKGSNWRR